MRRTGHVAHIQGQINTYNHLEGKYEGIPGRRYNIRISRVEAG
jgi:hypothetical protein